MASLGKTHTRISRNPAVMVGKPVVAGTRVPVDAVLRHLAYDLNVADLFEAYPHLTPEDVQACLSYAADVVEAMARRTEVDAPATP
ncbi:MAG: DUF433 domain-containing protein [Dehalococcoidia bacterium]|nr:DUF433 domain-containing protein [Dehalococcoidia bacterium]